MGETTLNFNLFNSLILAGLLQGLVFGIIVFLNKKYKVTSTRYLAALIIAFSVNNLSYYLLDIKLISRESFFLFYYFPNALLSPPLMYCYVKTYLKPELQITKSDYFLFLPFALFSSASILYKVAVLFDYNNPAFYDFIYSLPMLAELVGIVFTQIILIFLFVKVRQYEKNDRPENRIDGLNWLKWILLSLFLLTLVWIYEMIMTVITNTDRSFYFLWIGMSIMIYWLGHLGIYKFGVQQDREYLRNFSNKSKPFSIAIKHRNEHIVSIEKIIVEEKKYLDANLNLDSVADELNLSKSHLSRLINSELGMSFPDYINSLRVEEAKMYLQQPEFSDYTLIAIGLEAGFNSKTTFNNSFKKCTGLTPSEFRKSLTIRPNN